MDSEQKRKINRLILELRALMEEELELVLKHYGIFLNRNWLDEDKLDFLSEEEKETKKKLEIFIKRKEKIGIKKEESTKEFITEATYHWLNRIFGLKCLESRDLIEEIITTRSDYSGRSYFHRNYLEAHPELKKREDGGFFQCLFEFLSKLTTEIQIIFDPTDIHMIIKPRITILKEIIKKINNLERKIYQNDEFLGWIYQYFHDKDRDTIYRRIKAKKTKIKSSYFIPLTQLYTEKYMVKFLVQNSIGAIWMEMHPESNLYKDWEYYIKNINNESRFPKNLSDLKILDPACGSGHFLIYIFDFLYDLYLEEGKVAVEKIPKKIIENNLFGIDIDSRAIQISALLIYIKAKEKNQGKKFITPKLNLISADVISFKTDALNEFLERFQENKFLKKLVLLLWSKMENIREMGTLLQIEKEINQFLEENLIPKKNSIINFAKKKDYNWSNIRNDLLKKLREFLDDSIQTLDVNKEIFAREEEKSIWLLDVFEYKFDLIITNPPYLATHNLDMDLKKKFKKSYPSTYLDMYTMFMERMIDLISDNGYISLIVPQSFMFLNSYKKFRLFLLKNIHIIKLNHLGQYAFFDNRGAVLQTALILLRKKQKINENFMGIYHNLSNLKDPTDKIKNLTNPKLKYIINQEDFKIIQNSPFIYWIPRGIREIFKNCPQIETIAPAKAGLQTGDNERFLRYWWEVNEKKIASYGAESKNKWYFYAKGGAYNKWYGNLQHVVNWEDNGREIRKLAKDRYGSETRNVNNQSYYFLKGITYSFVSNKFSSRLLPSNCLFDVGGSSSFPLEGYDIFFILGYLNSKLVTYFLSLLNPTVNTQVGDINRLPFNIPKEVVRKKITNLVKKAIKIKMELTSFQITEWEFSRTGIEYGIEMCENDIDLQNFYNIFIRHKEELILKLILIEDTIDTCIFEIYEIKGEIKEIVIKEQGQIICLNPLILKFNTFPDIFEAEILNFYSRVKIKQLNSQEIKDLKKQVISIYEKDNLSKILENISYISLQLNIHPISVFNIINREKSINFSDFKAEISNFLSKIILDIIKNEKSGILILNKPSNDTILSQKILIEFDKIFGEENTDNILKQITNLLGKPIDDWVEKDFFNNHMSQFKKRPIIWHLSSEERSFQCFIFYHKLSQNLLLILRNRYLEKRLTFLREESKNITESLKNESNDSIIKEYNKKYIKSEDSIEDLQKFSENLKKIIDMNIEFDEDKGVKQQILPFQKYNLLSINKVV